MALQAWEQVRPMRNGGSQPHLMKCSDGNHYVVKFKNNPQGRRTLVNEMIATRLGEILHVPMASGAVVSVDRAHIDAYRLGMEAGRGRIPFEPGRCYGSRFIGNPKSSCYGPTAPPLANPEVFWGALVLDMWLCNADQRQAVFHRAAYGPYDATMIDHGCCFTGCEWRFDDRRPGCGNLYRPYSVYERIHGIDSFTPWLTVLEEVIDMARISAAAEGIPEEWYDNDATALKELLRTIHVRRHNVRGELLRLRCFMPHVFVNWEHASSFALAPKGQALDSLNNEQGAA